MSQKDGIPCCLRKRKDIGLDPLPESNSYAAYVHVVKQLVPPAITDQICFFDLATLDDPELVVTFRPEQYPLLSITRQSVQLIINAAGQGVFDAPDIESIVQFADHLLACLTVQPYEPEYMFEILALG